MVDLSAFTTYQMILQKPDKSEVTKTAVLFTDGTDGIIYYDTVAGDLDQSGTWKRRAKISTLTSTFTGDWIEFEVSA